MAQMLHHPDQEFMKGESHMRTRNVALALLLSLVFLWTLPEARADVVMFKDGTSIEGVIARVEKGTVYLKVENEEKTFDILLVESMNFNTPHLVPTLPKNVPVDHFLKDVEAQEIVRNMKDLESTAAEIRRKAAQIRTYWMSKQPIASSEVKGWDAAKEDFRKPLARYQELLNDLYFHVLSRVDEYNFIIEDSHKIYVGVKGIRIGSPLVAKDQLPLRNYVPGAWYDTIFYEGYNVGYNDGYANVNPKSD
jgi:hypothetical protein